MDVEMNNSNIFIWMDQSVCSVRQKDVRAYCTWVEERLVPSFGNWDEEQERVGSAYLARMEKFFNPEVHDPYDFYESAHEFSIDYCLTLAEVNSYMMGMAISGLYHLWERQVLEHLEREISNYTNDYVPPKNWKQICEYFINFSTDLSTLPFFECLDELRLVTNVAKHGVGISFEELKKRKSLILEEVHATNEEPVMGGKYSMLRAPIYPRLEHFLIYKEAVLLFWSYDFWRERGDRLYYAGAM